MDLKRKYILYRRSLNEPLWIYDDVFSSREEAENMALKNSENSSWKIWKIDEILRYE